GPPPRPSRATGGVWAGLPPATILSSILLVPFDGLEQRPEVPRAEALVALALDDLEEERSGLGIVLAAGRLPQEDLQQVFAFGAAVDQDAQLAQDVEALRELTDPDTIEGRPRAALRAS